MIGDAAEIEAGAVLAADICIVGSGAAGISLALALLDSGLSVLLLEGGGAGFEAASQALYRGAVADPLLHSPTENYRRRAFGGSTAIWGGRCVPFDAIDFEARPWVAGSGWPFGLGELAPWYGQANALCEAGRFAYAASDVFPAGLRPMLAGFAGKDFTADTLERFSIPTDFGARYHARLAHSGNVRLLLHASVVALRTSPDGGAVDRLDVVGPGGRRLVVRAGQVVLALGGLETPRLLLASRGEYEGGHPDGIGNAHGQVGRHYMCHVAGTLGTLRPAAPAWHGYDVSDDGVYCRRRLALTPAAQCRLRTGNFVARLHHPRIPDPSHRTGALSALYFARPFISHEYGKRLHNGARTGASAWLAHLRNVAVDTRGTAGFLSHWLRHRTLAARKYPSVIVPPRDDRYSLDFHAEQEPNPLSRVSLAHDTDALGLPRLHVDWRHTALDMHTIRASLAALAAQMSQSGAGSFAYDPEEVELAALQDGAYGGHHIGTARMSRDARTGVVDADCRVHGVANLFVAGSAVFATSSQANPTLTIVALALRLADHLKNVVDGQEVRADLVARHGL